MKEFRFAVKAKETSSVEVWIAYQKNTFGCKLRYAIRCLDENKIAILGYFMKLWCY